MKGSNETETDFYGNHNRYLRTKATDCSMLRPSARSCAVHLREGVDELTDTHMSSSTNAFADIILGERINGIETQGNSGGLLDYIARSGLFRSQ